MEALGQSLRLVHIAFGFVGLCAFWIPVFARKGGVNHVRYGKVFTRSAYVVLAAAAVVLGLHVVEAIRNGVGIADRPEHFAFIVFLGYLTLVTFVPVRHGLAVLRNKSQPAVMRTPLNQALAIAAIAASVGIVLYALVLAPPNRILLFALSPIGVFVGNGILRYVRSDSVSSREWLYEHLGSMLGAGIAFHTAFAVFGAAGLFDLSLSGWQQAIPWVAPTVIGVPAIALWSRHYRRKFASAAAA